MGYFLVIQKNIFILWINYLTHIDIIHYFQKSNPYGRYVNSHVLGMITMEKLN